MSIVTLICAVPLGFMLSFMGLASIYTAFFNRDTLVEGHPHASVPLTAGIAVVMGTILFSVGLSMLAPVVGW